ncbi:MAG: endonuclease/exonuclease/phosphatase family protein [Planctomycetota bacterium]
MSRAAPRFRFAATLTTAALLLVCLLWMVGQVFRDRTLLTAWCFYIPSPALIATLLAASVLLRKRRRYCALLVAIAIGPLLSVLVVENRWTQPPTAAAVVSAASEDSGPPAFRVVHWNVMWGKRGWPEIAQQLVALDADAYVLSEAAPDFDYSEFDGYDVASAYTMVVITRGKSEEIQPRFNKLEIRTAWIDWWPPGHADDQPPLRLLMADISAMLNLHRDPVLRLLSAEMARLRPDLVVGDLNSPRLSRGLAPPPAGYRHAYEEAGAGWSYTWPTPLPVLAIDHTLCGRRIATRDYRLETSWLSDHRRQVIDLIVVE